MREKSVNSYMISDLFAKLLLSFVLLLFLFFGLEYAKKKKLCDRFLEKTMHCVLQEVSINDLAN